MKVLVVTGSSGGHIFPALSFLDTLKEKHSDIDTLLVLPKRAGAFDIILDDYKVRYISISNIKLSLDLKFVCAILKYFKGSLEGLIILLEFRPDVVVGFGSIVCIPLVLFAWLFRIKTLIHEQNFIPGRANRFLAKFSDKIALSFEGSRDYFLGSRRKTVLTGNLIRRQLKPIGKDMALDFFGFGREKFTVLVMGGSLGSHRINGEFLSAVSKTEKRKNLQVIHLCGQQDGDMLRQGYKDLGVHAMVSEFLSQMQYAYSAAELVICRSGATTITEIIFFQLPAIVIPYPFAYGHQEANARVLADNGCVVLIKEGELSSSLLKDTIGNMIDDPDRIRGMRSRYGAILQPNANDLLVSQVMSLN